MLMKKVHFKTPTTAVPPRCYGGGDAPRRQTSTRSVLSFGRYVPGMHQSEETSVP
jgi:hypothetical protein